MPGSVRFRLKQPWPDFMTFYGSLATGAGWIVPRKYLEKVGDEGFKKAPIGAGPVPLRLLHSRCGAGAGGLRAVLAEDAEREAPRVQVGAGRGHPPGHAQARRGRHRLPLRRARPRRCGARRGSRFGPTPIVSTHWLVFLDQWDPKSPWHDRRVRLAANHAINRQAINEAETLGSRGSPGASSPRPSTSTGSRPPTPTIPPGPSSSSPRPATRRASTPATSGAMPPPPP